MVKKKNQTKRNRCRSHQRCNPCKRLEYAANHTYENTKKVLEEAWLKFFSKYLTDKTNRLKDQAEISTPA